MYELYGGLFVSTLCTTVGKDAGKNYTKIDGWHYGAAPSGFAQRCPTSQTPAMAVSGRWRHITTTRSKRKMQHFEWVQSHDDDDDETE